MRDQQTCIECGKLSPETETNYTLISAQFGWRLSRRKDENGMFIVEWRCPECWRDHKEKVGDGNALTSKSPGALGASTPPRPPAAVPSKAPPLPHQRPPAFDPKKFGR